MVENPSRMSGNGRVALPDVREWWEALLDFQESLSNGREWLRGTPGCPGVVGKPSRMFRSGQDALPNV